MAQKAVERHNSVKVSECERIEELFRSVFRHLFAAKRMKAPAFELTLAQARCLWTIDRDENLTMRQLSEQLSVTPATASLLIDRLANMGLVRREDDPKDRRIVRVCLTRRSQSLLNAHKREHRKRLISLLNRLTSKQRQALVEALETLESLIRQARESMQNDKPSKPRAARRGRR